MSDRYDSAEQVRDASGRQYHIGLAPGDAAPNIVLVGDPARAHRTGERLSNVKGTWKNREYVSITGEWEGVPVTVMATGMGCDNTEIAVIELASLLDSALLIRAGTCGGLQPGLAIGDLVVTWGAVRLENTSLGYVPEGYPAAAHPDVAQALLGAARRLELPSHFGMTATAAGFYGAQGRSIEGFPARDPGLVERLGRIGVLNMEMETSTLLTLASLRGFRAGAVCTVFANRHENEFVKPADKHRFEDRTIDCALEALRSLAADPSGRAATPR